MIVNTIKERTFAVKNKDLGVLENRYKNLNINSIINLNKYNEDSLNKLLYEVCENIIFNKNGDKNKTKIHNVIFNSIKYKNIGGVKFEVKGRLTRRYRADRSVFKKRLIGGLKNIESSFKRLPSMIMRGYEKSNVEYSILTSKRRIGSFAVKGWISGRSFSTAGYSSSNFTTHLHP